MVVTVAAPDGAPWAPPGRLLVVPDRLGVADALVAALEARGARARIGAELLDDAGVVWLAGLGGGREGVEGAFRMAREAGKKLPKGGLFAVVSGQGGRFGAGGDRLEGALAGLAKTVALEWEGVRCLAVDLDADAPDVDALAAELLTDRELIEVGLDGPCTLVAREKPIPDDITHVMPVHPGELVVVSGGARGVTAAVVVEMARRWRPTFLLLGRSPLEAEPAWATGDLKSAAVAHLRAIGEKPTPKAVDALVSGVEASREVRATLAAVREAGGAAGYLAVDVRDPAEVAGAVGAACEEHGPVKGLVHAAGVLADKLCVEKTDEAFDRVFSTKVDGLQALLEAVDPSELSFVAMFSSVAGRYGNRGQCDYAMGNEALARTARELSSTTRAVVKCFDWGPWEAGMVTPALKKHFEGQGLALVGLRAGARAFCDEIEVGDAHVEVVWGGPDGPLAERLRGEETLRLSPDAPVLRAHRLDGKGVVPAVWALEAFARAARKACPGLHLVCVRDLAVLKGIVVDRDVALTLRWEPVPSSSTRALSMTLSGEPGALGLPVVHYRAIVELDATRPEPFAWSWDGAELSPYPHALADAYRRFLFHGPALRGITEVSGLLEDGIVGRLRTSTPGDLGAPGARWETDPVALDSALQLMVLWVRETTGASALPSAVGVYRQYAPLSGALTCRLGFAPTKTARGGFRATFLDEAGRVVAEMDGAEYTANAAMNPLFTSAS